MFIHEKLANPRSLAQMTMFLDIFDWCTARTQELGDVIEVECYDTKIIITIEYNVGHRGCYEAERKRYSIPNEIFFSETDLSAWRKEQDSAELEANKVKKKFEEEAKAALNLKAQEARDRNEYLRLKAKFETQE